MRFSAASILLLPALVHCQSAAPTAPQTSSISTPISTPVPLVGATIPPSQATQTVNIPTPDASEDADEKELLELREVVNAVGATQAITQANPMSTMWVESWLPNGQTTWVEVIYSQTFASVPAQAPTPSSGQIGLGTHTGVVGVYKTDKERKKSSGASMVNTGTAWSAAVGLGAMAAGAALVLW